MLNLQPIYYLEVLSKVFEDYNAAVHHEVTKFSMYGVYIASAVYVHARAAARRSARRGVIR